MMIKLRPQQLRQADWAPVARQLDTIYREEVLADVLLVIREATVQRIHNATGDAALRSALRSGKIQYAAGVFSGNFTAAVSSAIKRLGGRFLKRSGIFKIEQARVPAWVIEEAGNYRVRAITAHQAIQSQLEQAVQRVQGAKYQIDAKETVDRVDSGWRASAAKLKVKPELSAEAKKNLATDYSENLSLSINKWLEKDILALRQDVQQNAEEGYRFDRLIERIQYRAGVGRRKAKFLARQETGLFISNYRSQRFQETGVRRYEWSTSHDARVRPEAALTPLERIHAGNHRILDGQTFTYAGKAPAHYMSSGKACNPGEDYNCRCVDIPVLG